MIGAREFRLQGVSTWLGVAVIAAMAGAAVPLYVGGMGEDSGSKLLALPAALVLLLFLTFSRAHLLLLIVLIRASTEVLFDATRVTVGGAGLGIGGLVNGFAILIAALLVFEKPQAFSRVLGQAWGPFLALIAFGAAISPDKGGALRLFLQLLSTAAVFVGAFYFVRDEDRFRSALKLVLWSSVVPLLFGLYQLGTGGGHDYADEGLRIRSTFSHPNPFGFYLTLVISVAFYMLKGRAFQLSQGKRIALSFYLVCLLAMLVLTKTRSAWLACGLMFVAYALFFERRYFVYMLLAGGAALLLPGVGDRLIDFTQGGRDSLSSLDRLNSFAWRESLWTSALGWMQKSRYLFGYGLEAFKYYAPTFFAESNNVNWGAHNVYVQLFFDLGILGVACFVWLFGRLIAAVRPLLAVDRMGGFTFTFVMAEFLVVAASDNMLDYLSFNWYLWFIVGAGTAWAIRLRADAAQRTSARPA